MAPSIDFNSTTGGAPDARTSSRSTDSMRAVRRDAPTPCPFCQYDVRAQLQSREPIDAPTVVCSECGHVIISELLKRRMSRDIAAELTIPRVLLMAATAIVPLTAMIFSFLVFANTPAIPAVVAAFMCWIVGVFIVSGAIERRARPAHDVPDPFTIRVHYFLVTVLLSAGTGMLWLGLLAAGITATID